MNVPGFVFNPIALAIEGAAIGFLIAVPVGPAAVLCIRRSITVGAVAGYMSLWLVYQGFKLLTGKEGMGGGDIKLLAMMGAFLGWKAVPFIIFASSLVGSLVGVSLMLIRKKDAKLAIPFGPYLAIGALLYIFCGRQLIHWYLAWGGFYKG